jgi:Flp pilus assembly pilin Flp
LKKRRGENGVRKAGELGQAMTEYILVIGLVALPIIAAYNRFQDAIKTALINVAKLLSGPGV